MQMSEREEKLSQREESLVAALRDSMDLRKSTEEHSAELSRALHIWIERAHEAEAELEEHTQEVRSLRRHLSDVTERLTERSDELCEVEARMIELADRLNEAKHARELDKRSHEAEVGRLRMVIEGYEVAVTCLHGKEVVDAIQKAQLDMPGLDNTDASADPVKFLYRLASKASHPDHGGSAELFNKVRTAYERLSK